MKYNIGDRIRFKNSKNSNEIYKVLEYNEEEGYKTRLEQVGATIIIPEWQIEYTELVNEQVSEQVSKSEDSSVNSSVKKLKLIDVLNKIANGELKEGTKVIHLDNIYIYKKYGDKATASLYRKTADSPEKDFFYDERHRFMSVILTEEVELIEPHQFREDTKMIEPTDNTKIEELDILEIEDSQNIDNIGLANSIGDLRNTIRELQHKLNEVIRHINKGAEK